jgi:hypothetical protein
MMEALRPSAGVTSMRDGEMTMRRLAVAARLRDGNGNGDGDAAAMNSTAPGGDALVNVVEGALMMDRRRRRVAVRAVASCVRACRVV